jgi:hypothetical protein
VCGPPRPLAPPAPPLTARADPRTTPVPIPQVRGTRRPPSTYRTAGQRAKDILSALVNAVIVTVRFTFSLPGRLWALRLKSREQWAADWAKAKKTIKHEAHHYWVRAPEGRGGKERAGGCGLGKATR